MKKAYLSLAAAICLPIAAMADASYTSGNNEVASVSGNVTVSGKTELHLTSRTPVSDGTSINLVDDNSWLFFNAVKPQTVLTDYLKHVKVAGEAAVCTEETANVRLSEWGSGTVVIPHGNATDMAAVTVYDKINCRGNSTSFAVFDMEGNFTGRQGDLGEWDNRIKSFKLRRGYMCTFANNADGSGHSRVYIADEDDIVVNVLPEGFVTYDNGSYNDATAKPCISALRVMRWQWVSKKGWGGWTPFEINFSGSDTYYTWSDGKIWTPNEGAGFYPINHEFVPIKQNRTDPKMYQLDTISEATHLLGYNEPDRPDQANLSQDFAISQWPQLMKMGYRLGSPAPSSVWTWEKSFWDKINLYNYRCDFAVAHVYEYTTDWAARVNQMYNDSKGRPCWVTEYNNGANWTNESWPGGDRKANEKNLEHQRQYTVKIMDIIENLAGLERAYYYNWVEDCRAYVLYNKDENGNSVGYLTPAGKVFHDYVGKPGYKAAKAYDHVWKIAPPYITATADYNHEFFNVTFYDHNGEMGQSYNVYLLGSNGYELAGTVTLDQDYSAGETVTVKVPYPEGGSGKYYFKATATSYNGTVSAESETCASTEPELGTPDFKLKEGGAQGNSVTLEWGAIEGAQSYRVRRGSTRDNTRPIGSSTTETEYTDRTTTPETAYYYQVGAQNPYCTTVWSQVKRVYSGALGGIATVEDDVMDIRAEGGQIIIDTPIAAMISIIGVDGRAVRTQEVPAGTTAITGLAKGLYIVNGQKIAL